MRAKTKMTTEAIENSQDIIDSRDVISRIADLESELERVHEGADTNHDFEVWLEIDDSDEARELKALRSLAEEAEGYCSDWKHGEALIRDSYFEDYARELATDIGAISGEEKWPCDCIDWERAARELRMDYTSVEFGGVTYWTR